MSAMCLQDYSNITLTRMQVENPWLKVTCQLKWVQLEAPADFRFEKFSGIRVPLKEQKCNADLKCLAPFIWWLLFYLSCIWDTECETLEYNCNWVKSFQCSLGENSHSMLWNNIKDEWQNTSWIRSYQNYWCRYRHDGDQCLFSVPIQKLSTEICKKKVRTRPEGSALCTARILMWARQTVVWCV